MKLNLTQRYMETREWSAARKVASLGFALLGWHIGMSIRLYELTGEVRDPLALVFANVMGAWSVAVLACCAVGGFGWWRKLAMPWLPHVFAVVYAAFIVAWQALSWDPLAFTWIPLTALLFAFLFDERVGATLLGACLLLVVANDFIPWLESPSPAAGSVVEQKVQKIIQQLVAVLVIANFLFCAFVLSAQRVLEERLRESTRLIRRYVPAQLADRIAAGGHNEGARHERRKLTIFFSDIAGFTNLSDEQDAEELAGALNEYLSEMTTIADRHGATVNQLVGDGIMIFFGAPLATDDRDHALRAVRMAREMQQRMVELRDAWFKSGIQRPFHIRIGINTGFASVGDFGSPGRMAYSAIGQQTNLAARIQAHCEPDRVLLSHSTWGLVQDEFSCVDKGEIQVKGLHYPVRVYEVAA